jgi:hypothetical protein
MGLAEKKAINDVMNNDLPRYQARIADSGFSISLGADWEGLPPGTEAIDRVRMLFGEFANRFYSMGQNAVAKEEIIKQITSVVVRNDSAISDEYEFKMEIKDKQLIFSANLGIFTLSTTKGPGIEKTLEGLL